LWLRCKSSDKILGNVKKRNVYYARANGHMPEKRITALPTSDSNASARNYSVCPLHGLIPPRLTPPSGIG